MPFALITGASKGIGKAIASALANRGYDLLLVARSEDLLQKVSDELQSTTKSKCHFLALDLSAADAPQKVYDWCNSNHYTVSVLVNNAGYGMSGHFENYSVDEHTEMLQLNIMTLVKLTRLFLPDLLKLQDAYILNLGSSASYQAVPLLSAYAASKAFVLSFSRGLYQELRNTSVSVTCICPGPTDTNFIQRAKIGPKGVKTAERFNMTPEAVAHVAVNSLFRKKPEVIAGATNKAGAFFAWLLPKNLVEVVAKKLYE